MCVFPMRPPGGHDGLSLVPTPPFGSLLVYEQDPVKSIDAVITIAYIVVQSITYNPFNPHIDSQSTTFIRRRTR